jgi:hypothetical protein
VQPLPLTGPAPAEAPLPRLTAPFQILNTSMLRCATLNNDEVVALVDRFVAAAAASLRQGRPSRAVALGDQVA